MSPAGSRRARHIIAEEASDADLTYEDLLGPRRLPRHVRARDAAIWRIRQELGYSSTELGMLFARDHTTILASLKRHEALEAADAGN